MNKRLRNVENINILTNLVISSHAGLYLALCSSSSCTTASCVFAAAQRSAVHPLSSRCLRAGRERDFQLLGCVCGCSLRPQLSYPRSPNYHRFHVVGKPRFIFPILC